MARKLSLDEEINSFIETWGFKELIAFMKDVWPLFELYDATEEDDWVARLVGGDNDNVQTIRLLRTVYLMSRIADLHCGKLCSLKIQFKDLWQKMEKQTAAV